MSAAAVLQGQKQAVVAPGVRAVVAAVADDDDDHAMRVKTQLPASRPR